MNCPFCETLLYRGQWSYSCTKTNCSFYHMMISTTNKINYLEYQFFDQNKSFNYKLIFRKDKEIDTFLILDINLDWLYDEKTKYYNFKVEQFSLEEIKDVIQNCKDKVYKIVENIELE